MFSEHSICFLKQWRSSPLEISCALITQYLCRWQRLKRERDWDWKKETAYWFVWQTTGLVLMFLWPRVVFSECRVDDLYTLSPSLQCWLHWRHSFPTHALFHAPSLPATAKAKLLVVTFWVVTQCFSKTLVSTYKSTWRYSRAGQHHHHHFENLKSLLNLTCSKVLIPPPSIPVPIQGQWLPPLPKHRWWCDLPKSYLSLYHALSFIHSSVKQLFIYFLLFFLKCKCTPRDGKT
jgi:hypothetical protein